MNSNTNATAPETISMYEHEEEVFRMERTCKRMFITIIILIVLLFASNAGWLIYEGMFDTISYSQDGEGINNINTGTQGDILDGAETKDKGSQGRQSQGLKNP